MPAFLIAVGTSQGSRHLLEGLEHFFTGCHTTTDYQFRFGRRQSCSIITASRC